MEEVKIGRIYRHFKGMYCFVENIGYDSETQERIVIYKEIEPRKDRKTNLGKVRKNVSRRNTRKVRQYNKAKTSFWISTIINEGGNYV